MTARQNALLRVVTNPQSEEPLTLAIVIDGDLHRGDAISGRLVASGGTGGYVYSVSGAAWLSVDGSTGELSGTVPSTVGRVNFTGTVDDSSATSVDASLSIDVVSRLVGLHVTPTPGEVTLDYEYQLAVSGATGTVTWAVVDAAEPAGLTLHTTGIIDGTPTAPDGITRFTVRATDSGTGDTLDVVLSITVYPELTAHYEHEIDQGFSALSVLPIIIGVPYREQIILEGGAPPFRFEIGAGWPDGFSVSSTGLVTGIAPMDTDTNGGPLPVTVAVHDRLGKVPFFQRLVIIVYPQSRLLPHRNGSPIGDADGAINWDFIEGDNVDLTVTNDGDTIGVTIDASSAVTAAQATSLQKAANLSDVDDAGTSRTNLGLGTAATHNVPASGDAAAGEVVLGNDSRLGGGGGSDHGPGCSFSNGGLPITGTLTDEVTIQYAGTITGWTITGDMAGSATIAVSRATYANYPTMTSLFTASVSSAIKATDTGLSHAVSKGDVLRFSGSAFSAFTRCKIILDVSP